MKLKEIPQNKTSSLLANDLSLIIDKFSDTIDKYECENKIPISLWVEIEHKKNDLLRAIEILEEKSPIVEKYDINKDIINEINSSNDIFSIETINKNSSYKNNNCRPCNPIKIDWNLKLRKPEIKVSLDMSIRATNFLFSSNTDLICSSATIMSNGCIPDLLAIMATLILSLNTIISSVNLSSLSLSSFLDASIGAVLNISIKKAAILAKVSVAKSNCLSEMINEIINLLPTTTAARNRLSKEDFEKTKMFMANTDRLEMFFSELDSSLTNNGKAAMDSIFGELTKITYVVDNALERLNNWLDGLFSLSNFIPCERERSSSKPSLLLEEISKILTIINVITAIIRKKKDKQCDGFSEDLNIDDIVEVIKDIVDIDNTVKDDNGNTIGLIANNLSLNTVYLDMFGCNLPSYLDIVSSYSPEEIYSDNDNIISPSTNSNIGEYEINNSNEGLELNGLYNTIPSNGNTESKPTQNFNTLKPISINLKDINPTDNFYNIYEVLNYISKIQNQESDNNINDTEIIKEETPIEIINKEENKIIEPEEYSISEIIDDILNMNNTRLDIKNNGECK